MEIVLEKTTIIFRYIADKDVFERYYKGHLAKRLLQGRSVSDDAERGMLAKLKVECGYQFTHKLEGMFHDMKLSVDTMHAYQGHLAKTTVITCNNCPYVFLVIVVVLQAPEINISVTVLTSTFWPVTQGGLTCTLPPELDRACRSFEQFYFSRHSGRRLTWQPSLGNADVRVTFKAKTHEINVSTFALVILLLFQSLPESEFLTYEVRTIGDSSWLTD
jgi:cullin 3